MEPSAGAKAPGSSGRAMAAVSCPAPDFKARKLCVHPNADPPAAPAKPLIFRSFQAARQKAGTDISGSLSIKVTA